MVPGAPAADAPVQSADGTPGWLLQRLGDGFAVLVAGSLDAAQRGDLRRASEGLVPLQVLCVGEGGDVRDSEGQVAQRYDLQPGTVVLLRPDQHVCARWRHFDPHAVRAALERALGRRPLQAPERTP